MHQSNTWQKIDETKIQFNKYRHGFVKKFKTPDDHISDWATWHTKDGAGVFALTSDLEVICATQFRPGPERVFYDMPSGVIEPNEASQQVAEKELLEETGYNGELQFLTRIPIDGYSDGWINAFLATDCKKITEPHQEEFEFIEVKLVKIEDFIDKLYQGEVMHPAIALLALRELSAQGIV